MTKAQLVKVVTCMEKRRKKNLSGSLSTTHFTYRKRIYLSLWLSVYPQSGLIHDATT